MKMSPGKWILSLNRNLGAKSAFLNYNLDMRLNRFLARAGVASRRRAEEIILSGEVRVNGNIVRELATVIDPLTDRVEVSGSLVSIPAHKYYLINKPAGYTCTRADKHAAHTIFELLPEDPSLFSVGRLDRETTGLLIVTNDGDFAQNIIHPSKKIRKKYRVTTKKNITDHELSLLKRPINLEDGPASVCSDHKLSDKVVDIEIEEGRKRIVRRIFKTIGNEVTQLERINVGEFGLDVPLGKYRELRPEEVRPYV
jgi:23S rRNA pseudouridine2605 synthase